MPTTISGTTGVSQIQDGTVATADIADDAITDVKIAAVAATKLTGTIADARFPATLPAASGANLTSIPAGNLTGTVADARISALTSSKLTGALPAISAANLTSIPAANITGTLPAISAANLTAIPAANITGTLPAISGANLTGISSQGRNLFINGGFDVWQRGTSLAGAASFLADRWFNATSGTQSRQTFTVGQTDVPHNPTYYYRQVTGSTEWYETRQKIENVGITAGREVTLSYWMKGSSAFTNAPYRVQNFGSSGSSSVNAALTTASVTTSWARYTHTFTLPSITGKTVGAGNNLQINLLRANVNNLTIEIANCQLEFGDTATDFEQRTYGEELDLCKRYYQYYYGNAQMHPGRTISSNRLDISYSFPKQMRADPTLEATDISQVYTSGQSAFNPSNPTIAAVHISPNGLIIRRTCSESITANCPATGQITTLRISAEL